MNEQEREQIDFLIQGFLDGELTQRQRTELKRLAQHNPSIRKELHVLFRQKELFSSLPVEKAPKELAEEVRLKLERRMILDAEPAGQVRPISRAHLLLRRIAAVAAMLLLPLGILAILVIQIMKPADDLLQGNAPVAELNPSGREVLPKPDASTAGVEKAAVISLGHLTLFTDQPISVNEQIKNGVVSNNLLAGAASQRSESSAVYRIQCSQVQMLALLGDLESVWPNCSRQQLVLSPDDPAAAKAVVIEGIRPDQLKSLAGESNPVRLQMIAAHIERLNRVDPADYLLPVQPESEGTAVLQPVKPRIAWTEENRDQEAGQQDETYSGLQVLLVIEVKSRMGDQ